MNPLSYIIQVNILFVLLVAIYHFLLKRESNFRFNRYFLLFIIVATFILPFISIPISGQSSTLSFPAISDLNTLSGNAATTEPLETGQVYTVRELAAIAYAVVSAFLLILFSIKLFKIIKSVRAIIDNSTYNYKLGVYTTSSKTAPFTFFNNSIIPDAILEKKGAELIITHEKAHALQRHTLDVVLAELASCLLFLNPLKKVYKQYMVQNHEYIADAAALQKDKESKYTDLLIEQTLLPCHLQMVSFFAKPSILNRIVMMKNGKKGVSKTIYASLIATVILLVYACEAREEPEIKMEPETIEVAAEQFSDQHVFTIVEVQAEPLGGIQKFYDGISKKLEGKYPQEAKKMGIEGVVYLQFIIEKDGSLSNIQPVKGIGGGCDELAVEALKTSPKWTPGKQGGIIVRSQRVIPIRFVL